MAQPPATACALIHVRRTRRLRGRIHRYHEQDAERASQIDAEQASFGERLAAESSDQAALRTIGRETDSQYNRNAPQLLDVPTTVCSITINDYWHRPAVRFSRTGRRRRLRRQAATRSTEKSSVQAPTTAQYRAAPAEQDSRPAAPERLMRRHQRN